MIGRLPQGYRKLEGLPAAAVAHERFADVVATLLRHGTLHDWSAAHPERREYQGRGPVYSAPLPDSGTRVVVRHARRGGLLAPILGDLYLPPTPAPAELLIATILARAGIPTPPVIAFATYRTAAVLRRVDVMTVEVEGDDLASALARRTDERAAIRYAVAQLLGALLDVGAWHQDLNAKNILVTPGGVGEARGVVLDVDRVRFVPAGDPHVREANLERLRRSMEKLRSRGRPAFDDADFAEIARLAGSHEQVRAADRAAALEEYMP